MVAGTGRNEDILGYPKYLKVRRGGEFEKSNNTDVHIMSYSNKCI